MPTDSVPIDTVSRGRLRIWKRQTLARYQRIKAAQAELDRVDAQAKGKAA